MFSNRTSFSDRTRRQFLKTALFAGSSGMLGVATAMVRRLEAMGAFQYPTGIQKLSGDVRVNGTAAREGDPVQWGDRVVTGADGTVIFVLEKSVYLVHENTDLTLQTETAEKHAASMEKILRIFKGRALMVFNRHENHRVFTPTAVVGIRGSGAYVEVETDKTYFCLCYGVSEIAVRGASEIRETVETTHHESPRFIYGPEANARIEPAPVFNHTDEELIRLERMVFRQPPFVPAYGDDGSGGGSGGY
ncbi:MAG: hypothetical protein LJE65_11400 [Desulfobacteraceae bacterium]|nr:hypothetical protein [Desulfobacteraceae bacterium]